MHEQPGLVGVGNEARGIRGIKLAVGVERNDVEAFFHDTVQDKRVAMRGDNGPSGKKSPQSGAFRAWRSGLFSRVDGTTRRVPVRADPLRREGRQVNAINRERKETRGFGGDEVVVVHHEQQMTAVFKVRAKGQGLEFFRKRCVCQSKGGIEGSKTEEVESRKYQPTRRATPSKPSKPEPNNHRAAGTGTGVCCTKPERPTLLFALSENATVTLIRS